MHLSNMMDFYCGRGCRGKGWISALSEVSSAGIREMQKNLILFAPQFLDLIWEPQYCKKSQPFSQSWNLGICLYSCKWWELTPQVIHSESPLLPFGSEGSCFYIQDSCEAWKGQRLIHAESWWGRVGCTAKASLFSRAVSQVPAGGG